MILQKRLKRKSYCRLCYFQKSQNNPDVIYLLKKAKIRLINDSQVRPDLEALGLMQAWEAMEQRMADNGGVMNDGSSIGTDEELMGRQLALQNHDAREVRLYDIII
jgi:hypothetical protein